MLSVFLHVVFQVSCETVIPSERLVNNLDEYNFVHECGLRVGRGGISTKICGESPALPPRLGQDIRVGGLS